MAERYVRVNLYWGGQISDEAGLMTFNRPPEAVQRFPLTLKYERLQRIFRSKIGVTDPELSIVISGRYPMSFMANGFPRYGETRICDVYSLVSFLESPDTFSSYISITMLDMYASIQRRNIIQEPTDDEYTKGGIEMHNHNFEWSMQNHEMAGPSNPSTLLQNLNLSGGHPTHSKWSEIDSERSLDDESTDGYQSFDDDGDVDGEAVAIRDGNISYHSNAISYMYFTEESKKTFSA
ncbi:hypothetical protein HAX54_031801 [Datura stramonium]|uniref:Uncharacterized protein n=1 Tax=Datura stramonium TaxID=4076 RepID=A0ABS8V9P7_DATST|nr:hypothetical protein [Datura stramonium]